MYHGWGRYRTYFEGWYYKVVSSDEKHIMAVIPGIAMDSLGNHQAFVQVFDGMHSSSNYYTFPGEDFVPHHRSFQLEIGQNQFSNHTLQLDLPQIKGHLDFTNAHPWPSSWYSPGIMGPATFIPFLPCYHGVLSMDHQIIGSLSINGSEIDFTGGRGYLEKDWGRSFPKAYYWMQCNHFSTPGTSVKASVASVDWMGNEFIGIIAGVWHENKLHQFTTYNFTRLKRSVSSNNRIELHLQNAGYDLHLHAEIQDTTELISPIEGLMEGKVNESMTSTLDVELIERNTNTVLFRDLGRNAAVDKSGDTDRLMRN